MKYVMGGRECKVEHFMAKESHHTDYDKDRSAQRDIDFCQRARHSFLAAVCLSQIQSRNVVELTARPDVPSSPRRFGCSENAKLYGYNLRRSLDLEMGKYECN